MKVRSSLLCVSLASMVAAPAIAASSASANFGPLNIQLLALTGTPSITFFDSDYTDTYLTADASQTSPNVYDYQVFQGASPWQPSPLLSATAGVAQASIVMGGVGAAVGTTLSASGSAGDFYSANPNDYARYSSGANVPFSAYGATRFTLSAYTMVVFSGTATVAAAASNLGNGSRVSAYASTNMSAQGPGPGGGGTQTGLDEIRVFGDIPLGGSPISATDSRNLMVTFVNLTGGDMQGNFYVYAGVSGLNYANPVPEPETYALMLSGLAAMGLLVRRRRG